MRRKTLYSLFLAAAISLSMPAPTSPAYADETSQAEEAVKSSETEKREETKKDTKDETKQEKETDQETKPQEEENTENTTPATKEQSTIACVMPVLTGYEFDDGSFDVWTKGTALYVGEGLLVIPTRITALSYPDGDVYADIIAAKTFAYESAELDAGLLELKTVVVLPNGEYESCEIKTQGSTICLMQFNAAGLNVPAPTLSRSAWPDTVYMISYQGPSMSQIIKDIEAGEAIGQAKAVTIECGSDIFTSSEEQVGSVITNESGDVLGMVTRHSTEKASVVRTGDIIKLIEEEPELTPTQPSTQEYADDTDRELLKSIEELENVLKNFKSMDLSDYSNADVKRAQDAADKAEAALRTATPDKSELTMAKEALDTAVKALGKQQPENKSGGISTFKLILLLFGVLALFAIMIIVPIIVFKKPKKKDEQCEGVNTPSPFMQMLAKLLGVKLKNSQKTEDIQEEVHEERGLPETNKPEKKTMQPKEKTGDLKKDGYGGELARAMYEAEQSQSGQKQTSGQTQGEERKEEQPKNVILGTNGTSVLQKIIKEKKPEKTASAWLVDAEGKHIPITRSQYMLGKEQMAVDYCVPDSTVSRKHCIIRTVEGGFEIEDNSSTNGTFVNGVQIAPGKPVKLTNHDTITLSDVSFTFIDKEET